MIVGLVAHLASLESVSHDAQGEGEAHTMCRAMDLRMASSCLVGLLFFSNMYSYLMPGLEEVEAFGGASLVAVAMMGAW